MSTTYRGGEGERPPSRKRFAAFLWESNLAANASSRSAKSRRRFNGASQTSMPTARAHTASWRSNGFAASQKRKSASSRSSWERATPRVHVARRLWRSGSVMMGRTPAAALHDGLHDGLARIYTMVYTSTMADAKRVTVRAKLFRNGGSQAVRLPKDCRFDGVSEVLVHREGHRVILEPVDEWSQGFLSSLGGLAEDIPRPKQGRLQSLRKPFQ